MTVCTRTDLQQAVLDLRARDPVSHFLVADKAKFASLCYQAHRCVCTVRVDLVACRAANILDDEVNNLGLDEPLVATQTSLGRAGVLRVNRHRMRLGLLAGGGKTKKQKQEQVPYWTA